MYTYTSRILYSDVDTEGYLTLTGVMDAFQNCSSLQSEDLGIGMDYLREHSVVWLVTYWNILVYRFPKLGETVVTGTSPYQLKGFTGWRNFSLSTEDGELLAEADSFWPLMNTETGKPERIHPVVLERYELFPRFPMEKTQRKVVLPAEDECERTVYDPIPVGQFLLDTNGHVNNAQYVKIAAAEAPQLYKAHQLRVEYRKQAFPGDVIVPSHCRTRDGREFFSLEDPQGEPYAVLTWADRKERTESQC